MNQNRENFILRSTYQILQKKAKEIEKKLKTETSPALKQTYETGGYWHDNPQWDSTLKDYERLKERLYEIRDILKNPIFIEDLSIDCSKITIGTQIEVKDASIGKVEIYRIVGSADVIYDPRGLEKKFVSWKSPIARSLLGKEVGDTVVIGLPNKTARLNILTILPIQSLQREKQQK